MAVNTSQIARIVRSSGWSEVCTAQYHARGQERKQGLRLARGKLAEALRFGGS
jgi:hypothetical protein